MVLNQGLLNENLIIMRNYEVTFVVDPLLAESEIQATCDNYVDHLKNHNCSIVFVDKMGLKQLAYPIKKRTSGFYFCIEFQGETGEVISNIELAMKRDERVIRFLTVSLDKYGVKYNEDKRNGLIGTNSSKEEEASSEK